MIEVRKKQCISSNCTLGAYYFKSTRLYRKLYEDYYADSSKVGKYIVLLYSNMIQKSMVVTISIVDAEKVHVLGTPEELRSFIEK